MPFDFAGYDVDGQAGATIGTWSFDCTITTTLAAEVNVALVSLAADIAVASIAISFNPLAVESNLIATKTIDYSPYADTDDTILSRKIEIGDPNSQDHGTVDEEVFYGASHVHCGISGIADKLDYFRKCYGNSLVSTGRTYEVQSDADLTLVALEKALMNAGHQASMTVGTSSLLDMTKKGLTAKAKTITIEGEQITINSTTQSLCLYGQKVNLDAPTPAVANPPLSQPGGAVPAKKPSNPVVSGVKGLLNKMGMRTKGSGKIFS
jgi:hypothetical protein